MTLGTRSPLLVILFLATLSTLTSGHWFGLDYPVANGRDIHYHCSRLGQDCKHGGYCVDGFCECHNEEDSEWHGQTFEGYDCSINITGFPNDDLVWEGCPCQNVDFCYRGEDGVTLKCACPPDFWGEDCSNNRVKVECTSFGMEVAFKPLDPFDGLAYLGNDPDEEECVFFPDIFWDDEISTDVFRRWTDFNNPKDCNLTVLNATDEDLAYTYQLTIQYDPVVQHELDLILDVTCRHLANGTWTTESNFGADRGVVDKGNEIGSTFFPVTIVMTDDFGDLIDNTAYLGQEITMTHHVTDTDVYSALVFVESCTFSDSVGEKQVTVVENGCPNERSITLGFYGPFWHDHIHYPGVAFAFRVFRLGNDPVVKVACRVRLCKHNEESECEMPVCDPLYDRKKRDAGDELAKSRRKRQTRREEGMTSNTFTVLDPYDENEQAFQVTPDKCMAEPVVKSVGISLVVLITVLLTVSILLAVCVCRMTISRRETALKLRYLKDNPTRSFSNDGFEGSITGDMKSHGS